MKTPSMVVMSTDIPTIRLSTEDGIPTGDLLICSGKATQPPSVNLDEEAAVEDGSLLQRNRTRGGLLQLTQH